MSNRLDEFQAYRTRMNDRIAEIDHLGLKHFFNLDSKAYKNSALRAKEKELLGLVASMVLRCNDCIDYHILQSSRPAGRIRNFTKVSLWPWSSEGASSSLICGMPSRAWIWRAKSRKRVQWEWKIRLLCLFSIKGRSPCPNRWLS